MKSFKETWPIASLVLNVVLIVILLSSGSLFTPSANIGGQAISKGNLEKTLENFDLTEYEKYAVDEIIAYINENKINPEDENIIFRESTNGELRQGNIKIYEEVPLTVHDCDVHFEFGQNGWTIWHFDWSRKIDWQVIGYIPYW